MEKHEEVLVSIRQIIRAIDLYSSRLSKEVGLTGSQLVLMREIRNSSDETIRQIARNANMSQATATTILDRLEKRGLVVRLRSQLDKRKVHAHLTDTGLELIDKAPLPLQDGFIFRFQQLADWEQSLLLSSVQRISAMMNAEHLDASPILVAGYVVAPEQMYTE